MLFRSQHPADRLGNPPVQRVVGIGRGRRRRSVPDQPVLAVVGVGLDRPADLGRAGDAVAARVIDVGVGVVRRQLVVGVGTLQGPAHVNSFPSDFPIHSSWLNLEIGIGEDSKIFLRLLP